MIKALAKLLLLFTLREGYLLARNLLGLLLHPYKTMLRIFRERDLSQAFLILGLLAGGWLLLGLVILAKFLLGPSGYKQVLVDLFILVGGGLALGASLYLAYWIFVFVKNRSKTPFLNSKNLI